MAMTINTNIISINAQRNLGLSGASLGTTMQRLSSGLRVNSAKDDAAGLAIAERMNGQARGLRVAARNANDGISLAQTAEGALGKMGDMLQRMRELAVQSSNATNSADDRKALQAEVAQLRSEIDRVAKTTSFNGQKILDGSFAGGVFQVGANAGDNITVGNITNAKANALGKAEYGSSVSATVKAGDISNLDEIEAGTLSIRVGADAAIDLGVIKEANSGSERLGQVVAAINAKTADTGVTAFLVEGDVAGDYTVQLRSDNPEKGISLTGFTAAATGVGRAASVGFSTAAAAAYEALIGKIDALTAVGKTTLIANAAATGATAEISIWDVRGILADAGALSTAHLTGTRATAIGPATGASGATQSFQNAVAAEGLSAVHAPGSPGTASSQATTLAAMVAWKAANNQGTTTDATPTPTNSTPANIDTVKAALTSLKSTLATQWEAQQTANLEAIETALGTALSAADGAAFDTALTTTGTGLTDLLVDIGLTLPGTVPTLTAASTPEELRAAKDILAADVNNLLNSGLGITSAQVTEELGIDEIDIGTQSGAWAAIKHIDAAIDQVNSARADLGALQTRFEKSIENIDIMNENISAARGRIVDADFASETANLSRAQILQQAGTAMVAQANQLPQQVLSLLQ